ncbi:hypothetical protein [Archangium violaceum]|uniref:Knr4/Smi1-like domain-containing protein n=1 Tax=Archangium violaceum Cb vi76 TaxID=1406225 RepID=A0A084SEF2_9BACT|nr:hypothetical protein [Archangium violaceum]KFA86837.1 hypothetical protein Q664_51565 [Archangium violaceum Cb vi76]
MEVLMPLPGLERLFDVCLRLKLSVETLPPAREPPRAGCSLEGLPFDPVLADVYARLGYAAFATELIGAGWTLDRSDDQVHKLKENNRWWRENWWEGLGEPVIVFGGDIYTYATVPSLADALGRQPVVEVDTYEPEAHVMPVASNVDRFFDSYSHYLEALAAHPRYQKSGDRELLFPWDMAEVLARDEQLVELIRAGRFESLMKNMQESNATRRWLAKVTGR